MKNIYWIILILLVVVVGGYWVMRGSAAPAANYPTDTSNNSIYPPVASADTATPALSPTPMALEKNNIVSEKTDPTKGTYLIDSKGMTLYVFDNDQAGISNCNGTCAQLWPPYSTKAVPTTLPTNMGTFNRADGTTQYSWNNQPLYYYSKDKKVGNIMGDGIGGIWHLVIL